MKEAYKLKLGIKSFYASSTDIQVTNQCIYSRIYLSSDLVDKRNNFVFRKYFGWFDYYREIIILKIAGLVSRLYGHWLGLISQVKQDYSHTESHVKSPFSNRPGSFYHFTFNFLYYWNNKVHTFSGREPQPAECCQVGKLIGGLRIRTLEIQIQTPPAIIMKSGGIQHILLHCFGHNLSGLSKFINSRLIQCIIQNSDLESNWELLQPSSVVHLPRASAGIELLF